MAELCAFCQQFCMVQKLLTTAWFLWWRNADEHEPRRGRHNPFDLADSDQAIKYWFNRVHRLKCTWQS